MYQLGATGTRKLEASVELSTVENAAPKPASNGLLGLWVFLGLSAALTWAIWLWPSSNRVLVVNVEGWRISCPLGNLKLLLGNSLPGLLALMWASVQGKQQLCHLLSSLFAWRTQLRWYILAIAFPSGIFVVSSCAVLIFFPASLASPPILAFVNILAALPFGVVWEELAWRAFALRRLECRYSRIVSALIIGVYWAVWHIPVWVMTLNYLTLTLLLIIFINLVAWSVIFAFLYDRSGQCLPVTILLHATYFAVQNLVAVTVLHGTIHIIPIAAALSVCLAVIVANEWTARTDVEASSGVKPLPL